METLPQQILDLIINPPGNLIYHLVLAFAVLSCLQAALIARRTNPGQPVNRLLIGLGMLLGGQVALFLCSGLAWQGVLNERTFLPPLDRAIMLANIVWIVWLWNFPKKARLGDIVTGFLNLGVIILFLITYTSWSSIIADPQGGLASFNNTTEDWIWELSALFIVITGMAVLIFSRPAGWGFGVGMLSLILGGIVAHLMLSPSSGDLSGYLRLGQLAAFPLLSTLLNRVHVETPALLVTQSAAQDGKTNGAAPTRERRRYSASTRTVHAWLELQTSTSPEKFMSVLVKALAHTMLSDLCFIVGKPAYGHVVLQCGYDLIREEEMKGTMLDQSTLPTLYSAVQKGKPVRITSDEAQPPDMKALSIALGLVDSGSLMFLPLGIGDKPSGGILFLSPYSNRQWSADDQGFLASEIEMITAIVQRAQSLGEKQEIDQRLANSIQNELDLARQENQQIKTELDRLRAGRAAAQRTSTEDPRFPYEPLQLPEHDFNALVALQEEAQNQIAVLQAENERLQTALKQKGISVLSPDEFVSMETDLRQTLQEIAQLQNQLAEVNARNLLLERERKQNGNGSSEEREVITSVVQEIRQPMSSIMGYTDLLLAESVGILGAMQRQFLERVKASTERMRSLLDDLIRVTTMRGGSLELQPQPVELATIIDGAVRDTSAQLREKDITLLVDLPEELPEIFADQDAIQQIIVQLLQNAGEATPTDGSVTLRARMREEQSGSYMLLQVTDTGGGVRTEDLPRVFARRFRADKPLIQGLGDTGVGLSIAKTLVEAHGGRIWVESVPGHTTTFSALLPSHPNSAPIKPE